MLLTLILSQTNLWYADRYAPSRIHLTTLPSITVLFFAGARQRAGTARLELDVQDGATVEAAAEAACRNAPTPCPLPSNVAYAVNGQYAGADAVVSDGDEVAILPPVSGGADTGDAGAYVLVTPDAIDAENIAARVASASDGAVVVFHGITRDNNLGREVIELEYEAYSPMAEDTMREIVAEMQGRWNIGAVAVAHRTGTVAIGAMSMCLAVAAPHRQDGFAAAQYFVDELKQRVPIWKKERFVGGEVWINDTPGDE